MRAAMAGDIAGSRFERSIWQGDHLESACCVGFEGSATPSESAVGENACSFTLFHNSCFLTDDSLMMLAVMDWLLTGNDLRHCLKSHFRASQDPHLFGKFFRRWAASDDDDLECGSIGNGAAMRVAPVALVADDVQSVREMAAESARVTHQQKEAVSGAEAIASAAFLARSGETKEGIRRYLDRHFNFRTDIDLNRMRNGYRFSSKCDDTVPIALSAFFQSNSAEDSIRRAISMGGDTDTIACMAGAVAGSFWRITEEVSQQVFDKLDARMQQIVLEFESRFPT